MTFFSNDFHQCKSIQVYKTEAYDNQVKELLSYNFHPEKLSLDTINFHL